MEAFYISLQLNSPDIFSFISKAPWEVTIKLLQSPLFLMFLNISIFPQKDHLI
jgi:hypothetical protein